MTLRPDQLRAEAAYIAYHFHWSPTDVLTLSHGERRAWVREIARINTTVNHPDANGDW
ncbi:DUF6760 family protein [Kitasatospora sp. NPDC056327]|uniref:DUF6760 family protein n=1 Tax=Kitasatospora sp. NPDC056327 TaxID=3345785 RepID=UPI0035D9DF07